MSEVRNLQRWFRTNVKDGNIFYGLDKNQAHIVLDSHKNTLVTARAGSGKTRTIVAKIIYLLAHEDVKPEEIIVFAFNKKACTEINERLANITHKNTPLFNKPPSIATTFHAFAYQILGGTKALKNRLITEDSIDPRIAKNTNDQVPKSSQFITRAEQKFFKNYDELLEKIKNLENPENQKILLKEFQNLKKYHQDLVEKDKINFNQLIALASKELTKSNHKTPYKYIFVDEYQDFSMLFLELTKSLRRTCPSAHLLAVGDDWQAINRFAGSDVEYFKNFEKYFPEDHTKLFIPTNYRSGKRIVRNANHFMSRSLRDFAGCKAKNRQKSTIFYQKSENYFKTVQKIVDNHQNKSIKILSRNNDLRFRHLSLENFIKKIEPGNNTLSFSTIHRSKGLESDVVILLEIDAEKFPSHDKTGGLYSIFGDTEDVLLADESRLFYVALTRAKEELYILSKNPRITKENQKYNFFSYLNPDFLTPLD